MSTTTASAQPLVSIVTPTLNQAEFIEATLRSVMNQTYPSIEHIVVDGGSSDGTLEILERYAGHYNLSWTSKPDSGMYEAVNRGMKVAGGEVLAYLNSDDLYLPWTVETAVRRLRHAAADVVYGDALFLDEATRRVRLAFYPPHTRAFALRVASLVQPTVFWTRAAFERTAGFDQSLHFVGDLDFWIRLGESCRFAKVDEVMAIERRHSAAKTDAHTVELLLEARAVRSRHDSRAGGLKRLSAFFERARGWFWRRAYWAKFLLASRGLVHSGNHWGRFLEAARPKISVGRVLLTQAPIFGWGLTHDAVEPSREWIDALTTRDRAV